MNWTERKKIHTYQVLTRRRHETIFFNKILKMRKSADSYLEYKVSSALNGVRLCMIINKIQFTLTGGSIDIT